jgi:hypothetical protein
MVAIYIKTITLLSLEVKNIVFTIKNGLYLFNWDSKGDSLIQDVMTSESLKERLTVKNKTSPADF